VPGKTFIAGEILTAADTNEYLVNNGYQPRETVYFTSSGTFTKASYPWLQAIRVRLVGGGGGSGGNTATGSGQVSAAAGGGGGGYAESFITDIAGLADSVTVTVGAGGAGGAAGNNSGSAGGTSSFGAVSATGGGGGGGDQAFSLADSFPLIASGGSGSGGQIAIDGGNSLAPVARSAVRVIPSVGGASQLSGLLSASVADVGAGERLAVAGKLYGGGALGPTKAQNTATNRAGAAGGNGIVILELYA
jgi:hypothetical protein